MHNRDKERKRGRGGGGEREREGERERGRERERERGREGERERAHTVTRHQLPVIEETHKQALGGIKAGCTYVPVSVCRSSMTGSPAPSGAGPGGGQRGPTPCSRHERRTAAPVSS